LLKAWLDRLGSAVKNRADRIAAILHTVATESGISFKDPGATLGSLLTAQFKVDRLVLSLRRTGSHEHIGK